jgi:hypothetical protein
MQQEGGLTMFKVGDLVKFEETNKETSVIYVEGIGVVVSLDNGPFKDPDDPDMIQVKFGKDIKFVYDFEKRLKLISGVL